MILPWVILFQSFFVDNTVIDHINHDHKNNNDNNYHDDYHDNDYYHDHDHNYDYNDQ